jgi:hypothetical protein
MVENSIIMFKSVNSGWLEMEVASSRDSSHAVFRLPSASCDPLVELSDAVLRVARCYDQQGNFQSNGEQFFMFWEVEKQMYTCRFEPRQGRMIEVELSLCSDMYAGIHTHDDIQVISLVPLEALAGNIFEEMRKLLASCGLVGYRRKWGIAFPTGLFLQLYDFVSSGNPDNTADFKDEAGKLAFIAGL